MEIKHVTVCVKSKQANEDDIISQLSAVRRQSISTGKKEQLHLDPRRHFFISHC